MSLPDENRQFPGFFVSMVDILSSVTAFDFVFDGDGIVS